MSVKRFITLVAVFLFLLLPAVWFSAPMWLSKVSELMLAGHQCSDAVVVIDAVGWEKSHIDRLYCKDQKGAFEIEFSDAELDYTLSGLLQKRLELVRLDAVKIRMQSTAKSDGAAMPVLPPALDALPLERASIHHIELERLNAAGDVQQSLRGHAEFNERGLSFSLHDEMHLKGLQLLVRLDRRRGMYVQLHRGDNAIVNIRSVVRQTDSLIAADGKLEIRLAPLAVALKPWLGLSDLKPAGDLNATWQAKLPLQAGRPQLQQLELDAALDIGFSLHGTHAPVRRGRAKLNMAFKDGAGRWTFQSPSQIQTAAGMAIDLAALSGLIMRSETGWRAVVTKASALQIDNPAISGLRVPHLNIKAVTPVELAVDAEGGVGLLKQATFIATHSPLLWQGNRLASRQLELVLSAGRLSSISGRIAASGVRISTESVRVPESRVTATFSVNPKRITAKGDAVAPNAGVHLTWSLEHNSLQQRGSMQISSLPIRFGAGGIDLAGMIRKPGDYSIDSGSLSTQGSLRWQRGRGAQGIALKAQSELIFSDLRGHYQSNAFSGLSGTLHIRGGEHEVALKPSPVSLQRLQAGLPLTNISMRVSASVPLDGKAKFQIERLKAGALGGEIFSDAIAIDLARESNPFMVRLHHIDAAQIAAIRDQQELNIEGLLDGRLPFDWTQNGLKMAAGELHSVSGGLIRFTGDESARKLADTDPTTRMVLDILNDFHYSRLKIGASYRPDGALKLAVHLNGNNPGYQNGRAVAFNFNIEENILQLLHALRMAGGVGGSLEKGVQKKLKRE